MPPVVELLKLLSPAVPEDKTVLVMCDRGLRSPRLWEQICSSGWHPYVRQSINTVFHPDGGTRLGARYLVPRPGYAWVGHGTAFAVTRKQRRGTMIVIWEEGQKEPCLVMTDLPPHEAGVCWYGLRFWIEVGFKAIKSVGWQWPEESKDRPRPGQSSLAGTVCVYSDGAGMGDQGRRCQCPGRRPQSPQSAAEVGAAHTSQRLHQTDTDRERAASGHRLVESSATQRPTVAEGLVAS